MNIIFIIVGMALVTYLPRLTPGLWLNTQKLPPGFQKWLENIPYAALGALIIPGILKTQNGKPLVGLLGGAVAVLLSLLNLHIVIVMSGAILAALAAGQWMP